MYKNYQEYLDDVVNNPERKKPVVKAFLRSIPVQGDRCLVIRLDHPAAYLNHQLCTTSEVLQVFKDGSFETRNTIYAPETYSEAV